MMFFRSISILISLSLLAACSDVTLMHPSNGVVSFDSDIGGSFCSQPPLSDSQPVTTIFMIDMSLSNIGRLTFAGTFDPSQATDGKGMRIQKAIDYINNCGKVPKSRFAIVGFSDTILNNDPNNSRCTVFSDKNQAVQDLNQLLSQQQAAVGDPMKGVMKTTNYSGALDCLDSLVRSDISSSDPKDLKNIYYTTFFVTDGAPTTNTGNPIPTNQAFQFADKVKSTATVAREATGGLILQSVYYGNVDYSTAQQFLDPLSQTGGTQATIKIDDMAAVDYCSLAQSPVRIPFNVTQFAAVNLTALMRNGALLPDSDADGIPDNLDSAPSDRRSNGILLDSICTLLGSACAQFQAKSCNSQIVDPFLGLSQCDNQAMNLRGIVDDDKDGIPDAIELLKGSLPLTFDSDHQDGDGLTVLEKIKRGRQPYFKEDNIPANLEMDARYTPSNSGQCGSDREWSFGIINNPLVPTRAFHSKLPLEEQAFGHQDLENVIVVYYYSDAVNSSQLGTQVFAAPPIRVKYGSHTSIHLLPKDFRLVGEVPK